MSVSREVGKPMDAKKATPGPTRPAGPSKGLAAIDKLLSVGERHEALLRRTEEADELRRIQKAMHRLEDSSGGESVADVLEGFVASTPPASLDPQSNLTSDQVRVLERVGSFVDTMPRSSKRASTMTKARGAEIFTQSLITSEAARLLGVTESRIRQRVSNRTLYAIKSKAGTRFPRFQFTRHGELPGWEVVAPAIPEGAHPLAVQNLMLAVSEDLELEGELVSPYDWLLAAGDPVQVAGYVDAAFRLST